MTGKNRSKTRIPAATSPTTTKSPAEEYSTTKCCPPKPKIEERPLISLEQAGELEAVFKVLANGTRLRMLHALVRSPNTPAGALANTLGMKPQTISNQLQRLVDKRIVASMRDGNQIRYRVLDACATSLLDRGLCLVECASDGSEHSGPEADNSS